MAHLPALMSDQDFRNRAGRGSREFTDDELAQFDAFAQDASAQIRQVAETDFMTDDEPPELDVPHGILPVMFRVIDRAMENRLGLSSSTQGNHTWQVGRTASSGVYLTDEDEADIRKALDPPDTGFAAVPMSNFDLPEEVSS